MKARKGARTNQGLTQTMSIIILAIMMITVTCTVVIARNNLDIRDLFNISFGAEKDWILRENTVVTIRDQSVIGTVEQHSLGVNEMATRDANQFKWSHEATGLQNIKEALGLSSLRIFWETNDWEKPYESIGGNLFPVQYPWGSVIRPISIVEQQQNQAYLGGPSYYVVNASKICTHKPEISPPPQRAPEAPQTPAEAEAYLKDVTCKDLYLSGIGPKRTVDFINYIKRHQLYPLTYLEIGNESYARNFAFNPYKPRYKPEEYVQRLNLWYDAIKQADPRIQVGANIMQSPGMAVWTRYVLQNGKFDFLSVHQYAKMKHVPQEYEGVKLSYYKKQDVDTEEYPSGLRKLLLQYRPEKVNTPILVTEFEASLLARLGPDECYVPTQSPSLPSPTPCPPLFPTNQTNAIRSTLYTGFATGELYLDLLWPVKINGKLYEGAKQAYFLGLNEPWMNKVSEWSKPDNATYFPSWHIMSFLKVFQGKSIIETEISNNPTSAESSPALKVYAVKGKGTIYIAVFNHDPYHLIITDLIFENFTPVSPVNVKKIGDNRDLTFTTNSILTPILPVEKQIVQNDQETKFNSKTINNVRIPAHTMMLLEVSGNPGTRQSSL